MIVHDSQSSLASV